MTHDHSTIVTPITRRRLLQGALGGAAGLVAWSHGWQYLPERCGTAKSVQRSDDLGHPHHCRSILV